MKTKTTKNGLTAQQKEWVARALLVAAFVGLPTLLNAQANTVYAGEDASLAASRSKMINMWSVIITSVVVGVLCIKPAILGLTYAFQDDEERGQEAMKKLKAGIGRVGLGCGIAIAAGAFGNFMAKALL